MIKYYFKFFREITGDTGVLLLLFPERCNFSETYSDNLLLLRGEVTEDFSS